MPKPLILITAGRQNRHAPDGDLQAVTTGVNLDYVHAVLRAGGTPLLAPRHMDGEATAALVEIADGLLLTGGGDVVSLAYGAEPHPASAYQDPVRDAMELAATRAALARNLPILGICRGIQLLNVALGGTLIQDIPTEISNALGHYARAVAPVQMHTVDIEDGSLLARVLDAPALAVNSYHHQAIEKLGRGLRVNCRARDGVIEGVESDEDHPILAVQFHPEEHAATDPRMQALFNWLVGAA